MDPKKLQQERADLLDHMKALTLAGKHVEVLRIAESMLFEDPNDAGGLFYAATAHNNLLHEETAYHLMKLAVSIRPNREEMWQNMGHIADKMWRFDEALYCYAQAQSINPNNAENIASMASAFVGLGKPELAIKYGERALELDRNNSIAAVNKGFGHLCLGQWKDGWQGYDVMVGHKSGRRKLTAYTTPAKFWDGMANETVVVYGEQGIGDEIMFTSCIRDANLWAKEIIIDCHPKMAGLFARSFPMCTVYGTRHEESPKWMSKHEIESSCSMGTLAKFYRQSDEDFPRVPYLTADPDRRTMYRALLDTLGKGLKVGISWIGGNTYGGLRKLDVDRLEDLITSFPEVTWVNLQYKDVPTYGLPIHTFPYATQTEDYDDTAALVAELDLVISVPQAVVHLAGGLGKECWCMAPDIARWIYGREGTEHHWYESVKIFRGWDTITEQIKEKLRERVSAES